LGVTLHRLGGLPTAREQAQSHARRSTVILQALADQYPDLVAEVRHCIALNYYNIGHLDVLESRLAEAITAFEAGRKYCEQQIERDPDDPVLRTDLARLELYLCRAYLRSDRYEEARAAGQRAIALQRALLARKPDDYGLALELYLAQEEQAFACQALNRWSDALTGHEAARDTLKAAAAHQAGVVTRMVAIQEHLAAVDYNLAKAYALVDPVRFARSDREITIEQYRIADRLQLVKPLSDEMRRVYALNGFLIAEYQLEDGETPDLSVMLQSERIWDELLQIRPGDSEPRAWLVIVRYEIADQLEVRGRSAEARAYRDRALSSIRGFPDDLYLIAIAYADNVDLVDRAPNKLNAQQREARRTRFAGLALGLLREAVANGFRDVARLRYDPHLAMFHRDPAFQAIVSELDDRAFPADPFAQP
jgi:tetratricopeptide (TPR) repeat protein